MKASTLLASFGASLLVGLASAQNDPSWTCKPAPVQQIVPRVASGYKATLLMTNLTRPRSLLFDPFGRLLVLEKGSGIRQVTLMDQPSGVCVVEDKHLLYKPELTHGMVMSADQKTLFASSYDKVFAFGYDGTFDAGGDIQSDKEIITGMANIHHQEYDHESRELLTPKFQPDWLLVSRGAALNTDPAANITNGRSTIKYFNIEAVTDTPVDHATEGFIMAAGVRNTVGMAEHPINGTIWSVENSIDSIVRMGADVHMDNPAEELNFHGVFQPLADNGWNGRNYGFPKCASVWDETVLNNTNLRRGMGFIPNLSWYLDPLVEDATCSEFQDPYFVFGAHMAPSNVKFQPDGMAMWISFHGSWDRRPPVGYLLGRIAFGADGFPLNTPDRITLVMENEDVGQCPENCFRPTGIAFDAKGRLYMASDHTGEIYVVEGGQ